MINGVIPTVEGTRLVFVLKEIRCTREAIDAAEAVVIANAPPPPPPPTTINILTVPSSVMRT